MSVALCILVAVTSCALSQLLAALSCHKPLHGTGLPASVYIKDAG